MTCAGRQIKAQTGFKPAIVGASLGGLAGLFAAGSEGGDETFAALVLVDITPKMKVDGVRRIIGFMSEHSQQGFANVEADRGGQYETTGVTSLCEKTKPWRVVS